MTNPVFPTMTKAQDSKFYEIAQEDVTMKTAMDGGYVVSRAKHTRKPRRSFKTGFSGILNPDRVRLMDFYDLVHGGSVIFDWTDPIEHVVYQVRFDGPMSFKYVGIGSSQLWDVQFQLQQA
jgi:hypothetical protein